MKVPQELRRDREFDTHYCSLVKSLVPTRKRHKEVGGPKSEVTTPTTTPTSAPSAPPAKPKRIKRAMTEGSLKGSRVGVAYFLLDRKHNISLSSFRSHGRAKS